ncbi:MAG: hypothetical protein H7Y37_19005 [Anaerolineae bacterium]|nr:hypothetical protein [Gloeobacterales cyanobacterium ES-bin-313]
MLSLPIRFSPLIYTSVPGSGFGLQADQSIPVEAKEIFLNKIVNRHWDAYAPPEPGSSALYLYQISPEEHLFGWLYCDGQDDFGRTHVPYFLAYYYRGALNFQQMETILNYLQFGPETIPTSMEPMLAPNLWNYEPSRPGVRIPVAVREAVAVETTMGKLLDLYGPDKKIFGWQLETSLVKPIPELPALKTRLDNRRKMDQRMLFVILVLGVSIVTAAAASRLLSPKPPAHSPVQTQPVSTEKTVGTTQLTAADATTPRKR